MNAHRVNQGYMPLEHTDKTADFLLSIYAETPEEIHDILLEVVAQRLPRYYQCDPVKDIQVLAPMNRGGLGRSGLKCRITAPVKW